MLLSILALGFSAGAALADNSPPPGYQAAFDKCKSQGLTPGTNDFNKCIAAIVGAPAKGSAPQKPGQTTTGQKPADGTPPPGGGSKPADGTPPPGGGSKPADGTPPPGGGGQQPSSSAGKAAQACIQQGLKPNTAALNQCVARALLPAAQQSAWDACIGKSLTPGTGDFASCIDSLVHGNRGPALTARQQDDVDYCLGKGLKAGTADFKSCIKTAGKGRLPANAQAAVDECQSQGLTDPNALAACTGKLLTVKIPPPAGSQSLKPADVQAAFDSCLDAGKKAGSAGFQACVKKALGS